MKTCRHCENEITEGEEVRTYPYWPYWVMIFIPKKYEKPKYYSHKECKVKGEKQEAYECQKIDSDCNDCAYFKRDKLIAKQVWSGHCSKFDKEVNACPNFCSSHSCFKHRKDK